MRTEGGIPTFAAEDRLATGFAVVDALAAIVVLGLVGAGVAASLTSLAHRWSTTHMQLRKLSLETAQLSELYRSALEGIPLTDAVAAASSGGASPGVVCAPLGAGDPLSSGSRTVVRCSVTASQSGSRSGRILVLPDAVTSESSA